MENFKFKGDWAELADLWNLEKVENDKVQAEIINSYIIKHYDANKEKLSEGIRKDMNDFLDALSEDTSTGESKVFKVLREIEHDWTFIYWFTHNIRNLWT